MEGKIEKIKKCRNPLKSGQCFLLRQQFQHVIIDEAHDSRNPLKSGQCFLQADALKKIQEIYRIRSQSPQIGSMFLTHMKCWQQFHECCKWSQSPQIGSMFLT